MTDPEPAALRRELGRITVELDVTKHEALMEALKARHPHRIRLVERADPTREFACVTYALKLRNPPAAVVKIEGFALQKVYRSPPFLTYMVEQKLLDEIESSVAENGDLIVYVSSKVEHVGVIDGAGVRSKWGSGHVWRHPLFEVPEAYGSSIRFFRAVTRAAALTAFYSYARTHYGSFVVDRALSKSRSRASR